MPISTDDKPVQSFWKTVQEVFPHVTWNDFCRALDVAYHIQRKIKGRHCGNLGDKASQYLAVVEYARAYTPSRLDNLEVGTLFGGSCLMKLFALKDFGIPGKIICIDPMSGFYGQETDFISGLPVNRDIFFENIEVFGFPPEAAELRQCRSDAPDAIEGLQKNHFATVMIDGDHSYEGVRNDWHLYSQFVANLGIMLIDDYAEPVWPQITVFVHELQNSANRLWNRSGIVGTTFIVCRGPLVRESRKGADASDIVSLDQVLRQGRTGALQREELLEGLRRLVEESLDIRLGKVYLALAKDSLSKKRYSDCEVWLHRLSETDELLNKSSKTTAERANIVLGLGDGYRTLGQLGKEETLYMQELSSKRLCGMSRFGPLLRIGNILTSQKHFAAAEKIYDECLSIKDLPSNKRTDALIALSICYKRQAKYDQAKQVLLELSVANNLSAQQAFHINLNLGYLYFQCSDYLKAMSCYENCLAFENAPEVNLCDAVLSLGECYSQMGKAKSAEELYENSLQRCFSTSLRFKIMLRLSEHYFSHSRIPEFSKAMNDALQLNGLSDKELSLAIKLLRKVQEMQYQSRGNAHDHVRNR